MLGEWSTRKGTSARNAVRLLLIVSLVAGLGLVLSACSGSGDLSGNFYYTTQGGDVKRLADREIVLVAATAEFEAEWRKTVTEFKAAYEPVKAAADHAHSEYIAKISDEGLKARYEIATKERDAVEAPYKEHAQKLVAWGKVKTARTDVNGRYEFRGVRSGRYYLFTKAQVPLLVYRELTHITIHWWVPVEVKSGIQTVDLTASNTGDWPF